MVERSAETSFTFINVLYKKAPRKGPLKSISPGAYFRTFTVPHIVYIFYSNIKQASKITNHQSQTTVKE